MGGEGASPAPGVRWEDRSQVQNEAQHVELPQRLSIICTAEREILNRTFKNFNSL